MKYDNEQNGASLFDNRNNITDYFVQKIGLNKDKAFSYVYGLLNSSHYQEQYSNDLRKDLARIPIVKDKEKYVEIGEKLINLHLNYEKIPVYDRCKITYNGPVNYKVIKMKFAKKRNTEGKLKKDRSTIIFNNSITI